MNQNKKAGGDEKNKEFLPLRGYNIRNTSLL